MFESLGIDETFKITDTETNFSSKTRTSERNVAGYSTKLTMSVILLKHLFYLQSTLNTHCCMQPSMKDTHSNTLTLGRGDVKQIFFQES